MKTKFLKRGMSLLSMLLVLFMSFTPVKAAKNTGTTTTSIKPVFSSSFIQYWYADSWGADRWNAELTMLKNAGIKEIILQDIVDSKDMERVYPSTKLAEYNIVGTGNMVETALIEADKLGMSVRIGLSFNGDWWTKNASDVSWLTAQADICKTVVDEMVDMYGSHTSFTGWYIPYEFSQLTATSRTTQSNLNKFLKQITFEIKLKGKNSNNIMIAPFYNGKYSWMYSLSSWTSMVQNILTGTDINIVAMQDSVGAGYNSLTSVTNVYSYTKKATDTLNMALYADTETFTSTSSGNVSAPQTRISSQFSKEKPYVQGFVAFSIDHYQNNNNPDQVTNYNDYYNYYLANK